MGFQRGKIVLSWPEGHELHGFEVTMRRRPLGGVIDTWTDESDGRAWDDLAPSERKQVQIDGAAELVGLISSWNLENDEGAPVPITVDGLLGVCDAPMINAMWDAYNGAALKLPPPLPQSSGAGPAGRPEEGPSASVPDASAPWTPEEAWDMETLTPAPS